MRPEEIIDIIANSTQHKSHIPDPDYVVKRRAIYPDIKDQMDMLWHAMDDDPTKRIEPFYSTIKNIKQKYPKPE